MDGTIKFADYKNYRYNNITVKGKLDKKLFDGTATINDENVKIDLNGIIDFNSITPRFNLLADVTKANLKNLRLTEYSIEFSGKLNFDFTGSTIDNFLGEARITEAEIKKDGIRLPFDSLILSSTYIDNIKKLTTVSNEFTASVTGNFSIKDLPNAFTYFLNKYYPAYIKPPGRFPGNQDLKFDIYTYYVEEYFKMFIPGITGWNNSHFEGNLNLARNELNLKSPTFRNFITSNTILMMLKPNSCRKCRQPCSYRQNSQYKNKRQS